MIEPFDSDAPEDETTEDVVRRFSVSCALSGGRVGVNPSLRMFLAYALKENWSPVPINDVVISQTGMVTLVSCQQAGNAILKGTWQLCPVDFLRLELTDLAQRAELSEKDTEWLLALPGVKDLRESGYS